MTTDDPTDELHPAAPDTFALRRRVLLAGVLTLGLFLASSVVTFTLDVSSVWLLLAMLVIFFAVTRPLMSPVFQALRLRRRLAFQAFLQMREEQDRD